MIPQKSQCACTIQYVIPVEKDNKFFENIKNLAGKDGFVLISAFNGDNFSFAAPKI